jgi:tetratricopeptide (TPR) repeat protein
VFRAPLPSLVPRLALAVGLWLVGCAGPQLSPWVPDPGPYDRLGPGQTERLQAARRAADEGDLEGAIRTLEEVALRDPLHAGVAIALQETRLKLLQRGGRLPALDQWRERHRPLDDAPPATVLWQWYLARARTTGEAIDRLLAARLEPDRRAATFQLEELVRDEPDLAFGHVGLAHAYLLGGEIAAARRSLDAALALDPGQVRARRLEAPLLAREGQVPLSLKALERWLERTADDPLVSAADRDAVQLELAAALLDAERFGPARARLDRFIDGPRFDVLPAELRSQAYLLRAAAAEGQGRYREARDDAERASREVPEKVLPYVQIAILEEYRLGNPAAAREAWAAVEERAGNAPSEDSLGAFLYAQWARVGGARLDAVLASRGGAGRTE